MPRHRPGAFSYLPSQSGYNRRLHAAMPLLKRVIWMSAMDTDLWSDTTWIHRATGQPTTRSLIACDH